MRVVNGIKMFEINHSTLYREWTLSSGSLGCSSTNNDDRRDDSAVGQGEVIDDGARIGENKSSKNKKRDNIRVVKIITRVINDKQNQHHHLSLLPPTWCKKKINNGRREGGYSIEYLRNKASIIDTREAEVRKLLVTSKQVVFGPHHNTITKSVKAGPVSDVNSIDRYYLTE